MLIVRSDASLWGPQASRNPFVALITLGQISAEMKDFASARKYYEEGLRLEPNGQYAKTTKEALGKLKKK